MSLKRMIGTRDGRFYVPCESYFRSSGEMLEGRPESETQYNLSKYPPRQSPKVGPQKQVGLSIVNLTFFMVILNVSTIGRFFFHLSSPFLFPSFLELNVYNVPLSCIIQAARRTVGNETGRLSPFRSVSQGSRRKDDTLQIA